MQASLACKAELTHLCQVSGQAVVPLARVRQEALLCQRGTNQGEAQREAQSATASQGQGRQACKCKGGPLHASESPCLPSVLSAKLHCWPCPIDTASNANGSHFASIHSALCRRPQQLTCEDALLASGNALLQLLEPLTVLRLLVDLNS